MHESRSVTPRRQYRYARSGRRRALPSWSLLALIAAGVLLIPRSAAGAPVIYGLGSGGDGCGDPKTYGYTGYELAQHEDITAVNPPGAHFSARAYRLDDFGRTSLKVEPEFGYQVCWVRTTLPQFHSTYPEAAALSVEMEEHESRVTFAVGRTVRPKGANCWHDAYRQVRYNGSTAGSKSVMGIKVLRRGDARIAKLTFKGKRPRVCVFREINPNTGQVLWRLGPGDVMRHAIVDADNILEVKARRRPRRR